MRQIKGKNPKQSFTRFHMELPIGKKRKLKVGKVAIPGLCDKAHKQNTFPGSFL